MPVPGVGSKVSTNPYSVNKKSFRCYGLELNKSRGRQVFETFTPENRNMEGGQEVS